MREWCLEREALQRITGFTDHEKTGSTNINGSGNDFDVVLLVPYIGDIGVQLALVLDGWSKLGAEESYGDSNFVTYRKGILNIILCDDVQYFQKWRTAKNVCLYLRERHGLFDKATRVIMHQFIVDGSTI